MSAGRGWIAKGGRGGCSGRALCLVVSSRFSPPNVTKTKSHVIGRQHKHERTSTKWGSLASAEEKDATIIVQHTLNMRSAAMSQRPTATRYLVVSPEAWKRKTPSAVKTIEPAPQEITQSKLHRAGPGSLAAWHQELLHPPGQQRDPVMQTAVHISSSTSPQCGGLGPSSDDSSPPNTSLGPCWSSMGGSIGIVTLSPLMLIAPSSPMEEEDTGPPWEGGYCCLSSSSIEGPASTSTGGVGDRGCSS